MVWRAIKEYMFKSSKQIFSAHRDRIKKKMDVFVESLSLLNFIIFPTETITFNFFQFIIIHY